MIKSDLFKNFQVTNEAEVIYVSTGRLYSSN